MSRRRSALAVLALSALTLPFAPAAVAAPGDTTIPPARSIAEFCSNPTATQFTDVTTTGDANAVELARAVVCLATADVAQGGAGGRPATTYSPQLAVTRGQMASFVARMLDAAVAREVREASVRELPAATGTSPFRDVAANDVHRASIARLAQAGIVQGLAADRYGSEAPVTRAQMASFLNRAVAFAEGGTVAQAGTGSNGFVAPSGAEYYVDALPAVHRANIDGITSVGISQGTGAKAYGPAGNVTRQQMARFIARTLATLNLPAGEQRILTLLERFSASFSDADRGNANSATTPAPFASAPTTPLNSRTYTATGLAAGVEYRVTLVKASQITRATTSSNAVVFAVGATATGNNGFLVNTGMPASRIVTVNGAPAQNNTEAGVTPTAPAEPAATAVAKPREDGSISFVIRSTTGEAVVPVLYVNGGGTQRSYLTGGGEDFRLEVDAQGRAIERFGIAGTTTFAP